MERPKRHKLFLAITLGIIGISFSACLFLLFFNHKTSTPVVQTSDYVTNTDTTINNTVIETTDPETTPTTSAESAKLGNCTQKYGNLMLINPVFTVSTDYITLRKTELIDITEKYGIREGKATNGTPYLDSEAAEHLNTMLSDSQSYAKNETGENHEMTTRSCFRLAGTNCGRLCYKTGTSDHQSGLTCDLIDYAYGDDLDTDKYSTHKEWQWLKANSYKYGFIDRFPEEWAGGSMSQPINITED